MKPRADALYAVIVRHLLKRPAEAKLFGRRIGTPRIGFPLGKSGPGGGIYLDDPGPQSALYLIAVLASSTALDAAEVVQVYRNLADEQGHTLLRDVAPLIEEARTPEGRKRLRLDEVRIEVDRVRPRARIIRNGRVTDYIDVSGDNLTKVHRAARENRADGEFIVRVSDRTIRDIGEALGEPEHPATEGDDAPPATADEAPSETDRPLRANVRPARPPLPCNGHDSASERDFLPHPRQGGGSSHPPTEFETGHARRRRPSRPPSLLP